MRAYQLRCKPHCKVLPAAEAHASTFRLAEAGRLWPLTALMADFVAAEHPPPYGLRGQRVLELGGGTAALACALARAYESSAFVCSTDLPHVLPLMQRNVARNALAGRVHVAALPWGKRAVCAAAALLPIHVVLCCELVYWGGWDILQEDTRQPLRDTLRALCGAQTVVYFAFTVRDAARELGFLRALLEQDGFRAR
jgi:hypothetical protein